MRANVFEGARRTLIVVQVLWVLGVAAAAFSIAHDARVGIDADITKDSHGAFLRPEGERECDAKAGDESDFEYRTTKRGTNVTVWLCYRSLRNLVDKSFDIDSYTGEYAKKFQLTPEMESRADSHRTTQRLEIAGYAVLAAAGGWFFLWVLGSVIGWVARGFIAPSR